MQLPWFLAPMRIGAIFMSTSKYLTPAEVEYQLDQARPRLIIGEGGVSGRTAVVMTAGRRRQGYE